MEVEDSIMLAPYRTLVVLLVRDTSWRDYNGTGTFTVRTGPASRSLKLSPARLRQHLNWLADKHLIQDLQLSYGCARFTIPLQGLKLIQGEAGDSPSSVEPTISQVMGDIRKEVLTKGVVHTLEEL